MIGYNGETFKNVFLGSTQNVLVLNYGDFFNEEVYKTKDKKLCFSVLQCFWSHCMMILYTEIQHVLR